MSQLIVYYGCAANSDHKHSISAAAALAASWPGGLHLHPLQTVIYFTWQCFHALLVA